MLGSLVDYITVLVSWVPSLSEPMCVTLSLSLCLVGEAAKIVSWSYQQRAEEVLIRTAKFEETKYQFRARAVEGLTHGVHSCIALLQTPQLYTGR